MRKLLGSALAAILLFIGMATVAAPAFAHTGQFRADCNNLYFDGVRFPAGSTTQIHLSGSVGGHSFADIVPLTVPAKTTKKTVYTVKTNISQWTANQTTILNAEASWVLGHKQLKTTVGPMTVLIATPCSVVTPPPAEKPLFGTTSATATCVGSSYQIAVTVGNPHPTAIAFRIIGLSSPLSANLGPLVQVSAKSSLTFKVTAPGTLASPNYTVTVKSIADIRTLKLVGTITGLLPGQCPKPAATATQTGGGSGGPQLAMTGPGGVQAELSAVGVIAVLLIGLTMKRKNWWQRPAWDNANH